MSSQQTIDLIIGLAVLGLLVYRQLRTRPVRGSQRIMAILLVVGLATSVQYLQKIHAGTAAIVALAGSLALAAAFGAIRAMTVKIWTQDGQPWMQGSYLTAALWVLALAAHLGYDYLIGQHKGLSGLGNATILVYLAVSLAVQRAIVVVRAQRLAPAGTGGFGLGVPGPGGLGAGGFGSGGRFGSCDGLGSGGTGSGRS
jgi:hypothetical protein